MAKKEDSLNIVKKIIGDESKVHPTAHESHPLFLQKYTFGQRAADFIATFGGSWSFIIILSSFLILWMLVNSYFLIFKEYFDPYPFILLNLFLSSLAAFQAPVILMAQGRQGDRDRIDAKYDHAINRKAERENRKMMRDLEFIKRKLKHL